jgi:hypothetical protein
MWVFTKDGFFTAVSKQCRQDEIMIKANSRRDLEKLLRKTNTQGPIQESPEPAYRFHVILEKASWIQYLSDYVQSLNYETVRDNIVAQNDAARHEAYQAVWTTMHNWMGREALRRDDL